MPVPDPTEPPRRGRRNPELARELAEAATGSRVRRDDDQPDPDLGDDYPDGMVHRVTSPEAEDALRDPDEPEGNVYAVWDDLVVVKATHELPQVGGGHSWYTAGLTTRLDPGESPADGLRRAQQIVSDHLIETFNGDWDVVADMHDEAERRIASRVRSTRIGG